MMVEIAGDSSQGSDWESEGAYLNKDWKWIEAAINGASMVGKGDHVNVSGASDPQSLYDAGDAFEQARYALAETSQTLTAYTKAVAGDGRAWSGPGADGFVTAIGGLTKQIDAHSDLLQAPPGESAGVPDQLYDAGNQLNNAMTQISNIDHYYAKEAAARGAPTGSDGLVAVSAIPGLPDMMTNSMRSVMGTLVGHYKVTQGVADAATPPPVNVPGDNGTGATGDQSGGGLNGAGGSGLDGAGDSGLTSGYPGAGSPDGGVPSSGLPGSGSPDGGIPGGGAPGLPSPSHATTPHLTPFSPSPPSTNPHMPQGEPSQHAITPYQSSHVATPAALGNPASLGIPPMPTGGYDPTTHLQGYHPSAADIASVRPLDPTSGAPTPWLSGSGGASGTGGFSGPGFGGLAAGGLIGGGALGRGASAAGRALKSVGGSMGLGSGSGGSGTGAEGEGTGTAGAGGAAAGGSAGAAGRTGMPMTGGAGSGGRGQQGERTTWLTEDDDVWGEDDDVAPERIGR